RTHDPGPCSGCWTGTASSFNSWPWLARAGVPPKPIRFRAAYQTTLSRYLSVPARSNLPNECLPSILTEKSSRILFGHYPVWYGAFAYHLLVLRVQQVARPQFLSPIHHIVRRGA
ncbi:hypothetical protein JMJ78_0002073, partial [Colletotrichum scovillei]